MQDIATRAEVSTRDLYELCGGKQQLVLDTCDAIVTAACAPLRARPAPDGDLRAGLAAVLDDVVDAVLSSPPAARLAVIDVVAVGPAGVQRRRALITGLHELLRDAATREGKPLMSEAVLAVLAGGMVHLLDRHLRSGQLRPLRRAALDLATWGATYETARPRPLPARDPSIAPLPAPPILTETLPSGRHGLPAGLIRDHQRDRILEAVLLVSAEQGFEATPVKELIAAAGLTSKAFYASFASKEDAWTVAFEQAFSQLYLAGWRAARAARPPTGRPRSPRPSPPAWTTWHPSRAAPGCCSPTPRRRAAPRSRRSTRRSTPARGWWPARWPTPSCPRPWRPR